jgi:xanthine dehydrogenase YagT iron-sulfur-binding subunit
MAFYLHRKPDQPKAVAASSPATSAVPGTQPRAGANESRRDFLKGVGVAAAVTAVAGIGSVRAQEAPQAAPTAPGGARVLGPGPVEVEFTLNGEKRKVAVEPNVTLSSLLRNRMDVTGPKEACDRGACGSCSVLIDGMTAPGCMTLTLDVAGRDVRTVEGLASSPTELHAIQKRFIEHDALQCGYCTPGMVVACYSLLTRNQKPSDDDVREAVSGNICRCGTYTRVVSATLAAAAELRKSPREAPPVAGSPEALVLAGKGGK